MGGPYWQTPPTLSKSQSIVAVKAGFSWGSGEAGPAHWRLCFEGVDKVERSAVGAAKTPRPQTRRAGAMVEKIMMWRRGCKDVRMLVMLVRSSLHSRLYAFILPGLIALLKASTWREAKSSHQRDSLARQIQAGCRRSWPSYPQTQASEADLVNGGLNHTQFTCIHHERPSVVRPRSCARPFVFWR